MASMVCPSVVTRVEIDRDVPPAVLCAGAGSVACSEDVGGKGMLDEKMNAMGSRSGTDTSVVSSCPPDQLSP